MRKLRVGMIVPSLNTIAEDDFQAFCPPGVAYHVQRIRLRTTPGKVTVEDLAEAYRGAAAAAASLQDLRPDVVVFNCTGASVACGERGDEALADSMSAALGLPATNTMVAIKQALRAVGAKRIVHVCPFADDSSAIERRALAAAGFEVTKSVGLDFSDARAAALMEPARIAKIAREAIAGEQVDAVLLSCANVRAFEAAEALERELGVPVVTSNQAVLWAVLKVAGWQGTVPGGGLLFEKK